MIKKQKTFVKKELTQLLIKSGLEVLSIRNSYSLGYFDVKCVRLTSPVIHFFRDNKIRISYIGLSQYDDDVVIEVTLSKDY